MKYLMISGCVIVTGPPSAIWLINLGKTEPDDPSTFPNLTIQNLVLESFELNIE